MALQPKRLLILPLAVCLVACGDDDSTPSLDKDASIAGQSTEAGLMTQRDFGTAASRDGTPARSDGISLPDGELLLPDGHTLPDGMPARPDGMSALPDGIRLPDGMPRLPDGMPRLPDMRHK